MGFRIECFISSYCGWKGAAKVEPLCDFMNKHLRIPSAWCKPSFQSDMVFFFTKRGWKRIGKKLRKIAAKENIKFRVIVSEIKEDAVILDRYQLAQHI